MENTALMVFNNEEFGKVRTVGTPDDPKFCLADVCRSLELRIDGVVARLKEDPITAGVLSQSPVQTAGGIQQMYFVNEDGLYDVILESRKPAAKKFRKWITSEVLPSIRKTGTYSVSEPQRGDKVLRTELLRFAEATTLLDPTVRKKSFEVFLGTLSVEHPHSEEDHTCRAKNPNIKTITMQKLYDDYVVPEGIKVVPAKNGSLIPISVSSLHNYVIRSCNFALPKVINPPIKYLRRERLVDTERVNDIISSLRQYNPDSNARF